MLLQCCLCFLIDFFVVAVKHFETSETNCMKRINNYIVIRKKKGNILLKRIFHNIKFCDFSIFWAITIALVPGSYESNVSVSIEQA